MEDKERNQRILFLLKIWFYLTERRIVWPSVMDWIEQRINDEFPERPGDE